jgi:hypothetical protein
MREIGQRDTGSDAVKLGPAVVQANHLAMIS